MAIKKVTEELDMLIESIKNEKPEDAMTAYSIGGIDDSEYSMDPSNIEAMEQAFGHNQYVYDLSQSISAHMQPHIDQEWAARMPYSGMSRASAHINMSDQVPTSRHLPHAPSNDRYSHPAEPSTSQTSLHSQPT